MADIRSLVSQIPMEPGYVPAAPEPDLTVIQRLMGLPQTLRAVGQNLAVGAASLPYGIYQGFGNPAAGEAAMSQFQQEYGYTPTNPAAQQQLRGLGEFLQELETEYKIPPMISPSQLPSRAATAGSAMQLGRLGTSLAGQSGRLARELVREIQTTPPTGAVQLAPTPGLLEKSDIGFYSQLEAAVQPLQNKGTGQQYLAQIQKSAGVKPEEIQWTGLDEFLKGKQSVTKQEIQDYLQANRVDVQEVRLGETFAPGYRFSTYNEWENAVDAAEKAGDMDEVQRLNDWAAVRYQTPDQTKFSQYTLPGGENYREILLKLPTKVRTEGFTVTGSGNQWYLRGPDNQIIEAFPSEAEALSKLETRAASMQPDIYRSSHFDQPNILAHLRVNDRTVDGKKTLFVEEIQSDWHQAGRKKGYADRNKTWELFDPVTAEVYGRYATPEEARAAKAALPEDQQYFDIDKSEGVPDAPFKTSWHELSLKRAIQEAAEKGYDQIAFTTGKTQAERYDLSKQISRVVYNEPGSKRANKFGTVLYAYDKNGDQVIGKSVAPEELADYIGKEAADKLMKAEADSWGQKELAGVDLQVGGEGMKGFYDNILPKSLDKLGKKFGAKVGKSQMEIGKGRPTSYSDFNEWQNAPDSQNIEVWTMDITPQMRESVTTKGQPLFAIPAIGTGLLGAGMMQEEQQY